MRIFRRYLLTHKRTRHLYHNQSQFVLKIGKLCKCRYVLLKYNKLDYYNIPVLYMHIMYVLLT